MDETEIRYKERTFPVLTVPQDEVNANRAIQQVQVIKYNKAKFDSAYVELPTDSDRYFNVVVSFKDDVTFGKRELDLIEESCDGIFKDIFIQPDSVQKKTHVICEVFRSGVTRLITKTTIITNETRILNKHANFRRIRIVNESDHDDTDSDRAAEEDGEEGANGRIRKRARASS